MLNRETLMKWVVDAIKANHGSATIVELCKHVWENHEKELRQSGDDFYTWQYDIRWAGQKLRDEGIIQPVSISPKGVWVLTK
jgi:hypothetical protein